MLTSWEEREWEFLCFYKCKLFGRDIIQRILRSIGPLPNPTAGFPLCIESNSKNRHLEKKIHLQGENNTGM